MSTADKLNKVLETKADIKQALIDKGQNPSDVFSTYAENIRAINKSIWTGHVDVEGLKAIGWDDEDITYFQEHGVNWMEEDDEYYKVSDDNKALYGVLTADNYKDYKDRIIYMPKINGTIQPYSSFDGFTKLVALPLNIIRGGNAYCIFNNCISLTSAPLIVNDITRASSMFRGCRSLQYVPAIDLSKAIDVQFCYSGCSGLVEIDEIDLTSATTVSAIIQNCMSLAKVKKVIDAKGLNIYNIATGCNRLIYIKIKNLSSSLRFNFSSLISKESILYIIENEATESLITIELHADAYARLSTDPDIVAALENHPLVSLASV